MFSLSHNTGTKGHPMKLISSRFRPDKEVLLCSTHNELVELTVTVCGDSPKAHIKLPSTELDHWSI